MAQTEDQWNAQLPQQSNSQERISHLLSQIKLSNSQLRDLIYHDDKFRSTLNQYIQDGVNKIELQQYKQSLVYLDEAEKILQYAANCGKTLDRNLITTVLHNEACNYQKLWQLDKASNYLEAIIYNFNSYLSYQMEFSKVPQSKELIVLGTYTKRKKNLVFYYLQYCAVCSQIKKHDVAIPSAFKALEILKSICATCYQYQLAHNQQSNNLKTLLKLSKLNENITVEKLGSLFHKTKLKVNKFHQKLAQHKQAQQQLKNFSIVDLMQIRPIIHDDSYQNYNFAEELTDISIIYKALYMSICFFTLGTEYRLLATQRYYLDQQVKKNSEQFKKSELYHLYAIYIAVSYVPYQTVYLKHILKTFQNHFKVDLFKKDDNYAKISQQSSLQRSISQRISVNQSKNSKKQFHSQNDQQLQINKIQTKIIPTLQQQLTIPHKNLKNKIKKKQIVSPRNIIGIKQKKSPLIKKNIKNISKQKKQQKTSRKSKSSTKHKQIYGQLASNSHKIKTRKSQKNIFHNEKIQSQYLYSRTNRTKASKFEKKRDQENHRGKSKSSKKSVAKHSLTNEKSPSKTIKNVKSLKSQEFIRKSQKKYINKKS